MAEEHPKIYQDPDALAAEIERARAAGRVVVLANGCFDVVHGGHVSYLEDAARHGDLLVVAVNGDGSVRRLKGEGRPVCPIGDRLALLEGLRSVDYLIAFEEDSPRPLLERLRPDVHAKGTDYTIDNVPEREFTAALGIRTVITGDPKENATKTIIGKVRG